MGMSELSYSAKLTRLMLICTGEAHDVIEDCVVMEPEEGYKEDRNVMEKRFGNLIVITKAWLQKVSDGPQDLMKFVGNIRKYGNV